MSNKVQFHVRIPRWLLQRIKEHADQEQTSVNKVIAALLKERFSESIKKVVLVSKNVQ